MEERNSGRGTSDRFDSSNPAAGAGLLVAFTALDCLGCTAGWAEGHPGAAERPSLEARDEFEKVHKSDDEVMAAVMLVGALLAESKNDEASKEVAKTAPLAAKSQSLGVQLAFALA